MFENKKFKALFIAEAVLPWVVSVLGGIAIAVYPSLGKYFREGLDEEYRRACDILDFFFNCSMGYGIGLCVVLSIVGLISLVMMFIHLFGEKKEQKYSVARPLTIFLWSALCVFGTLVLMLFVIVFTYGQGV